MIHLQLSREDVGLLIEALAMGASRKESQARVIRHGAKHDKRAASMRRLRLHLMKKRTPVLIADVG